jgi:hypothetical protein
MTKLQQPKQYGTGMKTDTKIIKENRKPRSKSTHVMSINFQHTCQEHTKGK